ncbi:ferredoxin [Candidimonas sp. SYP-B2681]|uniref:ferredoxin n=1 Tax=Candidimonas sp. SYP-B2681 TaxID=2497686 RepID=UPI000F864475|nr:ferredoxin [Candidimonas sp. SYP-B2681]RTZ45433.1 ferredoxin [Candidimonas sp. SYP-B2681]
MYVILVSKPGKYRSEVGPEARVIESYEYRYCGKIKAIYQLVKLDSDIRIRITEDDPPHVVNNVPSKFLEKFETIEQARVELNHLAQFGGQEATMVRCDNDRATGKI